MKERFKKLSKLIFTMLYALYAVVAPVMVVSAASNTPAKGDVYDAATNTYGNSTSVKEGSLTNEGDVQVTKTVSKTDTLGEYLINFNIKGKDTSTSTTVPIYTVFVLDASGSMRGQAWTNAKAAAKSFSETLVSESPLNKIALVTFAWSTQETRDFEHSALTDDDLGSPGGGTSYTAGLKSATTYLKTLSDDTIKNVIFISDGEPNRDTFQQPAAVATLKAVKNVSVYSFAYNLDSTSSASEMLKGISTNNTVNMVTSTNISDVLQTVATNISKFPAGTNATLTDNMGSAFKVKATGSNKYVSSVIEKITEEGTNISFTVNIDPNSSTGLHDVNAGFNLVYTDSEDQEQTINCNNNPQVYWVQPAYTINYFIKGEQNSFKSETVTANLNSVINYDTIKQKISNNAPKSYAYDSMNPTSLTVGNNNANNVIDVYYDKIPVNVTTNTISKTGTDLITSVSQKLTYQVTYNAVIKDFAGSATVTIVDTLPYDIVQGASNLNDGTYNATNKTITWTEKIDNIDTFVDGDKTISITKVYEVTYSGIIAEMSSTPNNTFENKAQATLKVSGTDKATLVAKQVTTVAVKGQVNANYYLEGTTTKLADTVSTEGLVGSNYSTSAKNIYGYTVVNSNPANKSGEYVDCTTNVNYYYTKNTGSIVVDKNEKSGDATANSITDAFDYTLNYKATINDYVGSVTTTIVDTLPYALDTTKANELTDGVYNAEKKTITWTVNKNITASDKVIDFNKTIKLYYTGVDTANVVNKMDAATVFETTTETSTEDHTTVVDDSKVTTVHVDENDKVLVPSSYTTGLVGAAYTTAAVTIYGYTLTGTPNNANGKYASTETTVKYIYTKNAGTIDDTLSKTGDTTPVSSVDSAFNYNVKYDATVSDYVGTASTIIKDTLAYKIDATKSDLGGGTYDAEANTITWTINSKITSENRTITFNKKLSLYYIGINENVINNVTSTTTYGNEVSNKNDSHTSTVDKAKVTAKYQDTTGTKLAEDVITENLVGKDYTTTAKTVYGYTLKETPANATGSYTTEDITVIYVYEKNAGSITVDENVKTGDETVTGITDGFDYTVKYSATINNYVGKATATIVDTLPYEIDTTKSVLSGGTYNKANKTITWTVNKDITNTDKVISFKANIKLYYLNVTDEEVKNNVKVNTVFGNTDKETTEDHTTKVAKSKVTAVYVDEQNNTLAESVSTTNLVGKTYTTSSKTIYGYTLRANPTNKNGTYADTDTTVKYVYSKNAGSIVVNTNDKSGDAAANSITDAFDYTLNYKATINDYVGATTTTIVDTLPYALDTTKQNNLADGVYDAEKKTITWTVNKDITETDKVIEFSKTIKLYFTDVNAKNVTNTMKATTVYGNKSNNSTEDHTTVVDDSKVTAVYVDEQNKTLAESVSTTDLVGKTYTTSSKTIYGYTLKATPTNANGTYTTEDITVIYVYTKNDGTITVDKNIKTGDLKAESITDAFDYTLNYKATIDNYVGRATTTVVDTLPYALDTTKANELADGVYNAENKTITWTVPVTITDSNKTITFEKTIKLYYLNITDDTVKNTMKVNTVFGNTDKVTTEDHTTNVDKSKVTAVYVDANNETLAPSVSTFGMVGTAYTTTAATIYGYTLRAEPTNKNGNYAKADTTVTYIYDKNIGKVEDTTVKTGDKTVSSVNSAFNYNIKYDATVSEYVGNATTIIKDTLAYKIDVSKSDLGGGVYDATTNTITWTINNAISENNKTITFNKDLVLYYIGVTDETVTNTVSTATTYGEKVSNDSDTHNTTVAKSQVTAKYQAITGTTLATDVITNDLVGLDYTTSSKDIYGYTLKETPSNATGKYTTENITVIYVYTKNDGTIKIDENEKSGDNTSNGIAEGFNYELNYKATIDDYVGSATATIVDYLPYELDTTKVNNLAGGTYDEAKKTITWTVNANITNENRDIEFSKTIKVYYKDITAETVKNTMKVNTVFGNTDTETTEDHITVVKKSSVTAKYEDTLGNEIATSEKATGLVGADYNTTAIDIYGYTLTETPSKATGKFTETEITVTYVYNKDKGVIEEETDKTGDKEAASITSGFKYTLNYNAVIDDYVGESKTTLVDYLPFEIDLTKSDIKDGTYDKETKTITWVIEKTIGEADKKIEFTREIELFFIGVDTDKVENKFNVSTSYETEKSETDDKVVTEIKKTNVTVHYVDMAGNKIADDEVLTGAVGSKYETVEKEIGIYYLEKVEGDATGEFGETDKEVTYIYQLSGQGGEDLPPQTGFEGNIMTTLVTKMSLVLAVYLALVLRKRYVM